MRTLCLFLTVSVLCVSAVVGQTAANAPLTVALIGDAGTRGAALRGCASLLDNMRTGEHDGGRCSLLLFLGDTFGETGLNVPRNDVPHEVGATLGLFHATIADLGAKWVHAVPGESEYYRRKAVEKTALFGLVTMSEWPVGLTDQGVKRATEQGEWSFHARWPSSLMLPTGAGPSDSAEFIFFDSALLLRGEPQGWNVVLDSLRTLLRESSVRRTTAWHVLVSHHPLVSAGTHGGFTEWNDEDSVVEHVTGCDRDSNAFGYVKNWIDPEDLCTDRYHAYVDSITSIIARSGLHFQLQLASHDKSLQLLQAGGTPGMPDVVVISGASAEGEIVDQPDPARRRFTASQKSNEGRSLTGFAQLTWGMDGVKISFFNSRNGDAIMMGGGMTTFRIGNDGLIAPGTASSHGEAHE